MKSPLGWSFHKNSQLVDCFNYYLQQMIQTGIMSQILARTDTKNEEFNTISDAVQLSYENVLFPSLILFGGLIISACLVGMERVCARLLANGKKQKATWGTASLHCLNGRSGIVSMNG